MFLYIAHFYDPLNADREICTFYLWASSKDNAIIIARKKTGYYKYPVHCNLLMVDGLAIPKHF
jgi:hypothetical protein